MNELISPLLLSCASCNLINFPSLIFLVGLKSLRSCFPLGRKRVQNLLQFRKWSKKMKFCLLACAKAINCEIGTITSVISNFLMIKPRLKTFWLWRQFSQPKIDFNLTCNGGAHPSFYGKAQDGNVVKIQNFVGFLFLCLRWNRNLNVRWWCQTSRHNRFHFGGESLDKCRRFHVKRQD